MSTRETPTTEPAENASAYPSSNLSASGQGARPADAHGLIRVTGARENNLRNVDVEIPKRRLTVVTGVSGSGKSSLVFDTIAAESRRMINETYPAFVQGFMPTQARPDVDALSGLTTVIIVDQERLGANPRSTLGTATDAGTLLRILFSRLATPHIGGPNAYSFNVPTITGSGATTTHKGGARGGQQRVVRRFVRTGGMCPTCEGMGTAAEFALDELYDATLSLRGGALKVPGYSMDGWYGRLFSGSGFFDMDKPLGTYSAKELDHLLHQAPTKIEVDGVNLTYEGLIPKIKKSMLAKDRDAVQKHIRAFLDRAVVQGPCAECGGTRLAGPTRASTIDGRSIADVTALPITELADWLATTPTLREETSTAPLIAGLRDLVANFVEIGLGYLSLDRRAGTLSGGEAQRTKMVRHLGSALTDVTYVFDEPTVGLHPHDVSRMNDLLVRLRDKGNTVLVVEHEPETIAIADHVIDLGPGAGPNGGTLTFEGTVEELRASGTLTGRHLGRRTLLKEVVREPTGALEIRGVRLHNLNDVDVDIPTGVLTVLTGVAGSGKSSLVSAGLAKRTGVCLIDQSALHASRRSNPATTTGLLDPIRTAFARANGVKPALFSANSEGACPTCRGSGVIVTELGVMASVTTSCEDCEGKRYNPDVLEFTLSGRSITDVLEMPVTRALEFFTGTPDPAARVPAAAAILTRLDQVGLGYLTLGQSLDSLSGGERQRLKLADELGETGGEPTVIVLDEPTTGLHPADVETLIALLDSLVDAGHTVLVVEHNLAVMARADWIIDMGPGAGQEGGHIVFRGTPADLVAAEDQRSVTGEHLAAYVS